MIESASLAGKVCLSASSSWSSTRSHSASRTLDLVDPSFLGTLIRRLGTVRPFLSFIGASFDVVVSQDRRAVVRTLVQRVHPSTSRQEGIHESGLPQRFL